MQQKAIIAGIVVSVLIVVAIVVISLKKPDHVEVEVLHMPRHELKHLYG